MSRDSNDEEVLERWKISTIQERFLVWRASWASTTHTGESHMVL